MKIIGDDHYYSDTRKVFEISEEAYREKQRNWVEVVGYATGSAEVTHEDWKEVWEYCRRHAPDGATKGSVVYPFLVVCRLPNGKTAFVGRLGKKADGGYSVSG